MKKNKILSSIFALALALSLAVPSFAVDTVITNSGGSGAVPVQVTVDAPTFSVSVPTQLPINVDANGVVTTSSDVKIVNNSYGSVKVSNMTITGLGDWEIVDFDSANMNAEKVGTHKLAMQINGGKTTGDDAIDFRGATFNVMAGKNATNSDELAITYSAKVPAQASSSSNVGIATVTFTIGWNTAT